MTDVPRGDDHRVFYPEGAEWTNPTSGAVYKVIRREDGLFDWKLVKYPDGRDAPVESVHAP